MTSTKSVLTYRVWSYDVWGHAAKDCCKAYGCPCVVECWDCDGSPTSLEPCDECGTAGVVHDTEDHECDAGWEINDRFPIGHIEVETDGKSTYRSEVSWHCSNEAIVKALIDAGFLKAHVRSSDIDFDGDEDLFLERSDDGCPLFQLEFEKSESCEDEP